jgi:hypothetical protein
MPCSRLNRPFEYQTWLVFGSPLYYYYFFVLCTMDNFRRGHRTFLSLASKMNQFYWTNSWCVFSLTLNKFLHRALGPILSTTDVFTWIRMLKYFVIKITNYGIIHRFRFSNGLFCQVVECSGFQMVGHLVLTTSMDRFGQKINNSLLIKRSRLVLPFKNRTNSSGFRNKMANFTI